MLVDIEDEPNSAIKAADYLSQYLIDDIMNPIISKIRNIWNYIPKKKNTIIYREKTIREIYPI